MRHHHLPRPDQKPSSSSFRRSLIVFGGIVLVIALIAVVGTYASEDDSPTASKATATKDAGSEGEGECKRAIESMAKYDYEWTTGFLESPFHTQSDVNDEGRVTRWGNKVKFQNAFGAWIRTTGYWCIYDVHRKMVVDAEVNFPD